MCSKFEIILTKYEDVMLNSQNTLKTQKFMFFTQKVRAHLAYSHCEDAYEMQL